MKLFFSHNHTLWPKLIILLFCVISVILVLYLKSNPYLGWKTYYIQQYDISIKVPPNWYEETKKGAISFTCYDELIRDHNICDKDTNTFVADHIWIADADAHVAPVSFGINIGVTRTRPLSVKKLTPVIISNKTYQLGDYNLQPMPVKNNWYFYINDIETGPKSPFNFFTIEGNGKYQASLLKQILMSIKKGKN